RVVVAVDEPGAVGTQYVGPLVVARRDPQRPRRDGLTKGHVPAQVVGGGVGDVHFRLRVRLEYVGDRRDVAPELAVGGWLHGGSGTLGGLPTTVGSDRRVRCSGSDESLVRSGQAPPGPHGFL